MNSIQNIFLGYGNNDPNDPWKCTRNTGGADLLNQALDDNGSALLDIPSRTSQNSLGTVSNEDNKRPDTTTDRPFFLPPKETVIGRTSRMRRKQTIANRCLKSKLYVKYMLIFVNNFRIR